MNRADVIIIGSGISALTSAALLTKKGKSVIVLEQAAKPGGYMHSFKRFGELYDTGAHYVGALGEGQPFHTLLNYLGVYDEKLFTPLDPTGFDVFKFPDGSVQIPQGYDNVISELAAIFPQERDAIRKYFEKIQWIIRFFPTYEFNDASAAEIPTEAFEVSLAQIVQSLTSNPRLQSVFYAYCNLHGVLPEDVAFGFHAIVTDSLIRGPYGLSQGGDALTAKFVERIETGGGRVLTKHAVTSIEVKNRLVTEVKTENGMSFSGEWVISSLHPKSTFRLLSERSFLTPAFTERLAGMKESVGIFGIYAASTKPVPLNPLRNYYFFKSSDPRAIFKDNLPGEEPSAVFMSCPKRDWNEVGGKYPISLHAASPSEWFSSWHGTKYGKREADDYVTFKNAYTKQIFALVERYYDGLGACFDQYVTSSPLTNLHFNRSEEGSSYGIYHSIQNTGGRALGPRTKVLNLLLTGQNYLFPGLMGAAVSALRTCGHIVGIKPVLAELKQSQARG